ncbi:MAG: stage II sporulation protein R [Oscillibacter sp.]|nr:stage II sporulation protein R [Oscillibacter sp.]
MVKNQNKLHVWEIALLVGFAAAILWGGWALRSQRVLADKVVRLHILANSDSDADQALKLRVRDVVLERAEAILKSSKDRDEAETALHSALPELQKLAEQEIAAEGYSYSVTAELRHTVFPTRRYNGFTLPAGEYLALRIVIGRGLGHNWWCVVFPPLCTASTTDLSRTAMAAGLSEKDVGLITEESGGYVLKFKSIELWERWKEKLWNG